MGDGDTGVEFEALRRRAYGPGPGLADDPVALARLDELEELARAARERSAPAAKEPDALVSADPPTRHPSPIADAADRPTAHVLEASRPSPGSATRRRPRWHSASIAAIAALALALAAPNLWETDEPAAGMTGPVLQPASIYELSAQEKERVLMRIPLDGSFGSYVNLAPVDIPPFGDGIALTWAKPLGSYYGWKPWIARAANGDSCLLLERNGARQSKCISPAAQAQGQLSVDLSYYDVPWLDRPLQMTPSLDLAFRWLSDRDVLIMLDPASD